MIILSDKVDEQGRRIDPRTGRRYDVRITHIVYTTGILRQRDEVIDLGRGLPLRSVNIFVVAFLMLMWLPLDFLGVYQLTIAVALTWGLTIMTRPPVRVPPELLPDLRKAR